MEPRRILSLERVCGITTGQRTPLIKVPSLQNGRSGSLESQVDSAPGGSSSSRSSSTSDSHCNARSGRSVATAASVSAKRSTTGSMSASARDDSVPCSTSRRLPKSRLSRSMCRCVSGGARFAIGFAAEADDQLGQMTANPKHADSERHVAGCRHVEAARPDGP